MDHSAPDATETVAVVMVSDPALERPTIELVRGSDSFRGFPIAIELAPFDPGAVRSQSLWPDGRQRAYLLSVYQPQSSAVLQLVEEHDVAVLAWGDDLEVGEMFVRSGGRVRWRGGCTTENASGALFEFWSAVRRSGIARAAAAQRWRAAAEALLRQLQLLLDDREQLLDQLRTAQADLAVAEARIDQLEALAEFLNSELNRTAGAENPKQVGLVAALVIAVVAALAGGATEGFVASRVAAVNDQAKTTVVVCESAPHVIRTPT